MPNSVFISPNGFSNNGTTINPYLPIALPDGTAAAPSLTFASDTALGFYNRTGHDFSAAYNNTELFRFSGANNVNISQVDLRVVGLLQFGSSADLVLARDAANTLAQRNGTNAQLFNIYNTYTDAANYETGFIKWVAGNNFQIGTTQAGSGAARGINFLVGGTSIWQINTSGHLLAVTDNTYDIGASGATRPRTGYFGTSLVTPTVNATSAYQFNGNAFANATVGPSAPTGTTSTTLVMAGLAGSITTRTGKILLTMSGVSADSGANDGSKMQMSYGTSTAPVNGAALTGTQVGPIQQYNASTLAAAATASYGASWIVTGLTPGTTYWFDTAFAAITAGTATLTQACMTACDLP